MRKYFCALFLTMTVNVKVPRALQQFFVSSIIFQSIPLFLVFFFQHSMAFATVTISIRRSVYVDQKASITFQT